MSFLIAELPFIDAHELDCSVSADVLFLALWAHLRESGSGPLARLGVTVLRCQPAAGAHADVPRPGVTTLPGFAVTAAQRPHMLRLVGHHRWSRYDLEFTIAHRRAGGSTIRAVTRAAFPGRGGRVYHALVVRSGIHALVTRGLLRVAVRRAESLFASGQDRA